MNGLLLRFTGVGAMMMTASSTIALAQIVTGTSPVVGGSPAIAGASADYRVGPGDLLSISVYRSPDLQMTVRVGTNGAIVFPSLGEVQVGDRTATEIETRIAAELKRRGILIAPSVNVLVSEVRAHTVSVLGSVARPGEVALDRNGLTLVGVLARAGASFGTGAGIVTITNGGSGEARESYRISDLVSGNRDRPVKSGEILVVEAAPVIYVSGEVGRPGAYPLEAGLTVGQALALGGGVTVRGSVGRIRLERKGAIGTTQKIKGVKFDTPLQGGDLIFVQQRVF